MKRIICLFLSLLSLMSFGFLTSGCFIKRAKTVPEQLIQYDISNKFGSSDFYYTTTHNVDEATHIDTVTIAITVPEEYYQQHITGTCKYRYNKSNDTWDSYSNPIWKTDRIEYLSHKYTKKWDGSFKNGGTYSIKITDVDFKNGTVTGSFSASKSSLSLSGRRHTYILEASGTYTIKEEYDGYRLEITQSGCTFVFLLSKHYGVQGITIYDARTGYAV